MDRPPRRVVADNAGAEDHGTAHAEPMLAPATGRLSTGQQHTAPQVWDSVSGMSSYRSVNDRLIFGCGLATAGSRHSGFHPIDRPGATQVEVQARRELLRTGQVSLDQQVEGLTDAYLGRVIPAFLHDVLAANRRKI